MNASESTAAPFLNDYKRKFLTKRLIQTLLGGLLLKINSDEDVPIFIYLYQIVLFVVPFFFGGIFILASDLSNFDRLYLSIIAGGTFFIYIFLLKLIVLFVSSKAYFKSEVKRIQASAKSPSSIKKPSRINKNNLFNDEQDYQFDTCCSISSLDFVLPPIGYIMQAEPTTKMRINKLKLFAYILRILFDSLVSGYMMFCAVYFQSIVYLQKFYSIGGAVCIFVFNWIVLCIGFFSLCIREPPEPAIYQPYDQYKIQHYTRSFYIICFQLIEIIYNFAPSNGNIPLLAIFWLKIIIIGLPIAWFFGLLPPIDSFFLWLFEQCYIHLYGGSASASNLRLIVQLTLAVIVSLAHFIPSDLAIVIIFTVFGYILSSIDIIYIFELFITSITNRTSRSISPVIESGTKSNIPYSNMNSNQSNQHDREFPFKLIDWVYHVLMLILGVVISAIIFALFTSNSVNTNTAFQLETYILYACMGLFILSKIFADLQGVYVFFGLFRNPFYPKNCLSSNLTKKPNEKSQLTINQKRMFFRIIKNLRMIIVRIAAPLLMCAVVSLDCYINKVYNTGQSYWRTLVVLRAFRWIWQSSYLCLFEMSMMAHLILFVISHNALTDTETKSKLIENFLTGCLVASFARDRIYQLKQKIFGFILLTITNYSLKKQRRKSSLAFIILNFTIFLPFILITIIISCIISAPLLPLFTFPIFFFGFPRSKRFWPQKNPLFSKSISSTSMDQLKLNSSTSNLTSDSSFYAQLVPQLLNSFKELIKSGSIGSSIQADTYFLTRFQDRIMLIQIMETGHTYYIINIKGLELQETSCHTTEAQYIDDSFELAFENPFGANANSSSSSRCLKLNPNKLSCMQQKDILLFEAYSDAKNSLVGVMDSPDSLNALAQFYPKVLHYFMVKFLIERNEISRRENESTDKAKLFSEKPKLGQLNVKSVEENGFTKSIEMQTKTKTIDGESGSNFIFDTFDTVTDENESAMSKKNIVLSKQKDTTEFDDWSDNDSGGSLSDKKKTTKSTTKPVKYFSNEEEEEQGNKNPFDFDLNEILGTSEEPESAAAKKAKSNKGKKKLKQQQESLEAQIPLSIKLPEVKEQDFKVLHTEKNNFLLGLPSEWTSVLNESLNSSSMDNKNLKSTLISKKWIEKIFNLLMSLEPNIKHKLSNKDEIINDYEINAWVSHYKFILKCCQTLGLTENTVQSNFNAQSMHKFFKGDLPWSPLNEKITKELPDLHRVLLKSFQYTVKMVLDNATICPITDDEEFFDSIKTYEEEWFIGTESDNEYSQNILLNKPYIFSLCKDSSKKNLNSRTLSLQQIKSPLAQLNSEIVKSIWSSTNLELLYMTNDDDERYSIQAHPYILRNLTIQSSDPPLGYCIYNSENIYVSIVNPF